jgi:hypothetical protein|nr:bifunctional nuclease family protein [uncultured Capnocytophaga sp.]
MDLVRLFLKRIAYNQSQSDSFTLIMHELESDLKLPIIIGAFEAQSIALELEKRKIIPPRPLTHDLFKTLADSFSIHIKRVVIYKLEEGIFFSNMLCSQHGKDCTIDARTSDAIALALRFNAPIYTYKDIIEKAGIYIPLLNEEKHNTVSPSLDEIEEESDSTRHLYSKYSVPELKKMLNDCIADEDYEMAALLRDEISKRDNTF